MTMDSRQPQNDARPLSEAQFLAEAPLLRNLQKRAASATSLKEWAIARIQAAIYMARTSGIDEAGAIAKDIRSRFRGHEDAEIYIWLWILDGVLGYYQNGLSGCRVFLARALIVAKRIQRDDLFQYASSWSGHMAYIANDYRAMTCSLLDSRLDRAEIAEAACRAALTVAVSWQLCGETEVAAKWFARGRDVARSIGDRASIMASIENRAFVWLDRIWVESCWQIPSLSTLNQIELELRSGLAYEHVTSSETLIEQGSIARLRLLILRGSFDDALKLIGELRFDPTESGFSNLRVIPVLELWLRVERGLIVDIDLDALGRMESILLGVVDDDDIAVGYKYLSTIAKRFGYASRAIEFGDISNSALDRFRNQMNELRKGLESSLEFSLPAHNTPSVKRLD